MCRPTVSVPASLRTTTSGPSEPGLVTRGHYHPLGIAPDADTASAEGPVRSARKFAAIPAVSAVSPNVFSIKKWSLTNHAMPQCLLDYTVAVADCNPPPSPQFTTTTTFHCTPSRTDASTAAKDMSADGRSRTAHRVARPLPPRLLGTRSRGHGRGHFSCTRICSNTASTRC